MSSSSENKTLHDNRIITEFYFKCLASVGACTCVRMSNIGVLMTRKFSALIMRSQQIRDLRRHGEISIGYRSYGNKTYPIK